MVSTFWPFIGERTDTQYTHIKKKKNTAEREKKARDLGKFLKRVFDCHWNWSPLRVQVANGISTLDPILRYFIGNRQFPLLAGFATNPI